MNYMIEKKEFTNEEIKQDPLLKRYMEAVEPEQKPIDSTMQTGLEIGNSSSNNSTGNSTPIVLNEANSKDPNQQIQNESLSKQINQSSVTNRNDPNFTQNLKQSQLIDLIASTISNANNIDKNKVIQSINDLIEPLKARGGFNVIDSLKNLARIILKDPSGLHLII